MDKKIINPSAPQPKGHGSWFGKLTTPKTTLSRVEGLRIDTERGVSFPRLTGRRFTSTLLSVLRRSVLSLPKENAAECIKNNFGRYAHLYDKYSCIQEKIAAELIEKITPKGFSNILELGCGTGNFTRLLRNKFKQARLKALDISQEMVAVCREKLPEKGLEFIIADAEELELNERFDLVTSNATFQWFLDLEGTLSKYAGCLRKKGVVLFSTFGPKTFWELDWVLKSLFKDAAVPATFFASRQKLEEILRKNFQASRVYEKIHRENFSCLRDLLLKIKYSGIRGNGLGKKKFFSRQNLDRMQALYLDRFKGISVTYQVFYCRGIK
jgi:malonyl-CoA O-methyltransferase